MFTILPRPCRGFGEFYLDPVAGATGRSQPTNQPRYGRRTSLVSHRQYSE